MPHHGGAERMGPASDHARRVAGSMMKIASAAMPERKPATCHPVRAQALTAAPPVENRSAAERIRRRSDDRGVESWFVIVGAPMRWSLWALRIIRQIGTVWSSGRPCARICAMHGVCLHAKSTFPRGEVFFEPRRQGAV